VDTCFRLDNLSISPVTVPFTTLILLRSFHDSSAKAIRRMSVERYRTGDTLVDLPRADLPWAGLDRADLPRADLDRVGLDRVGSVAMNCLLTNLGIPV
jgi:hypothetical protein